jgi:predicted DNA-binding transcriptional regulator AlpA
MRKRKILRGMPELERITQMSEHTIRRLVEDEAFPAALVEGRWRAVEADVLDWIRTRIGNPNSAE